MNEFEDTPSAGAPAAPASWRSRVQAAYVQSLARPSKQKLNNMTANLALLQGREDISRLLKDFAINGVWLTGSAARGEPIAGSGRYELVFIQEDFPSPEECKAVRLQLETLTGKPFSFSFALWNDGLDECGLRVHLLQVHDSEPDHDA